MSKLYLPGLIPCLPSPSRPSWERDHLDGCSAVEELMEHTSEHRGRATHRGRLTARAYTAEQRVRASTANPGVSRARQVIRVT